MKVIVACESSGVVRNAFRKLGHDAWSCDILPPDDGSKYHYQVDILEVINNGWDIMIAHPPCTHLAASGARWFKDKREEQEKSLEFVRVLLDAPIEMIALENPVGIISSRIRKPDQIIQPWMFGHPEAKKTCLWLKGLPLLKPTNILPLPEKGHWNNQTPSCQNKIGPSPDRWKIRSKTYYGIAKAMAIQWNK